MCDEASPDPARHLGLVVLIAQEFEGRGLGLGDLIGEGTIGLVRAADLYDPSLGYKFSTYASHWIKQAIRHAIINTTPTIRLPVHMVVLLRKWHLAEKALRRNLGHVPSAEQVADAMGLSRRRREMVASALKARATRTASEVARHSAIPWAIELTPDPRPGPCSALDADDERRELASLLDRLDAREREVIAARFGLDGRPRETYRAIADRIGITREWTRKIEHRALARLRSPEG